MNVHEYPSSISRPPAVSAPTSTAPTVFVVDDDVSMRESLGQLIQYKGWKPIIFETARDFLSHTPVNTPSCIILDVELPDINGLELQQQMAESYHPPIIFLTGQGDIPSSVRAMKAGALDFLTKPFSPPQLMALIQAALVQDCQQRAKQAELDSLQRRYSLLTPREREVLPLVVGGLLNKQAAAHLGISEITLQIHRTNVMRKMEARTFVDLVRMASTLRIRLHAVLDHRHCSS